MAGIVDTITGEGQRKALRNQERAVAGQDKVIERMVRLFDQYMQHLNAGVAGGQFDPETQIRLLNESSRYQQKMHEQADAGTARILGYRPGDTAPLVRQRGISDAYDLARRNQEFNIRQGTFQNKLGAFAGAPLSALGGAQSGLSQQAGQWGQMASMYDPAKFWNAAMSWYTMGK